VVAVVAVSERFGPKLGDVWLSGEEIREERLTPGLHLLCRVNVIVHRLKLVLLR
jgi:hypothetical protein